MMEEEVEQHHEQQQQVPFCSVLNVVIDHILEPPSPLEPEEFLQVQHQTSRLPPPQKGKSINDSSFFDAAAAANQDFNTGKTTESTTLPNLSTTRDNTTSYAGSTSKGKKDLLVPVLRVFGPILRRGGSGLDGAGRPPQQSCCLYIHGAYPYLLARPRQAGPDGSMTHGKVPDGHVNWDSIESIARVAPYIASTLEAAIQSISFNYGDNNNDNSNKPSSSRTGGGPKVIRRVTVVQGRGFYTYCPGPPAPFLRVEYYNPTLRWKVKLVLEKGLELPDLYHPNPQQYHYFQYNNNNNNNNNNPNAMEQEGTTSDGIPLPPPPAPEELLRFHCYEAHIPYTMQFFKDWNLAGMSYIHLTNGKFRGKLPLQGKKQDYAQAQNDNKASDDGLFLQSNTPPEFLWSFVSENEEFITSSIDSPTNDLPPMALLQQLSQPSSQSTTASTAQHPPEGAAAGNGENTILDITATATSTALSVAVAAGVALPKRETSCNVEIDCTVQDILNVQSVMHSMPSEQEERDKIQWRAVPSLQEIWRQERRRMSKLLPPQDDFLSFPNQNSDSDTTPTPTTSQDTTTTTAAKDVHKPVRNKNEVKTPPFTLNVKKGAARPGARLAAKGMWSLINVTMDLQEEFIRALSQIVQRHKQTVLEMDRSLFLQNQANDSPSLRTSRLLFCGDDDDQVMLSSKEAQQLLTPTMDEAIEALGKLAGQQTQQTQNLTPTMDEAIDALGALAGQFETAVASPACISRTPAGQDETTSSSYYGEERATPSSIQNEDVESPTQSYSQGLQVIHGQTYYSSQDDDSIDGDHPTIDHFNSPRTLVYRSSQDLHESTMASPMTMEYNQQMRKDSSFLMNGNLYNEDFGGGDLEEYINPETLLPYDDLYFGEERCLVKFLVKTDERGTMRICGANALHCTREGHPVSHDRAQPGFYKTITTGNVVDGMVIVDASPNGSGGSTAGTPRSQQFDDEDEEEDDREFEHVLSMLATQIPSTQSEEPAHPLDPAYSQHDSVEAPLTQLDEPGCDATYNSAISLSQHLASAGGEGGESSEEEASQVGETDLQSCMESEDEEGINSDDYQTPDFVSPNSIETEESSPMKTPATNAHDPYDLQMNSLDDAFFGVGKEEAIPVTQPPTSLEIRETTAQIGLCSLERTSSVPSWLTHSAKYAGLREERNKKPAQESSNVFQLVKRDEKIYVQPVAHPPTSAQVARWYKRNFGSSSDQSNTKGKDRTEKKREREPEEDGMEIDGNSRKLVPRARKKMGRVAEAGDQGVEEVQWESSQMTQHVAASQQTPPDDDWDDDRDARIDGSQPQQKERDKFESPTMSAMSLGSGETPSYESKTMESSQSQSASQSSEQPLDGIGNQGGRIHVQGGGGLKAKTRPSQAATPARQVQAVEEGPNDRYGDFLPSPISFMSIEIHVQCRTGASRLDGQKIAMTPNSSKDEVSAVVYIYGKDPSGGESLQIIERGCIFVPLQTETANKKTQSAKVRSSMPRATMGFSVKLSIECVGDEKSLLLRLASIVRMKDPDMLLSWDSQGLGLGYLIERGLAMGRDGPRREDQSGRASSAIDMARLLGRTPHENKKNDSFTMGAPIGAEESNANTHEGKPGETEKWKGSGHGIDWDEKKGAGAAASSIVGRLVYAGWKLVAEEVKHGNSSYLPAIVSAVLNKRIPHHDNLLLTRWYSQSKGKERWRVLHHRLTEATATILLFDALDIIGRAGEAARLSGVEFSQSFPGMRGSQYKVEGVLLRALQSLRSDERGSKKGSKKKSGSTSLSGGTTSMSEESKSQTQSPWKLRRANLDRDENVSQPLEDRQYFFYSPANHDTNKQEALEVQALTLEPMSGHYRDPVVVCDFTALYPSLVIAYNLCYSTCAGKLEYHSTRREMRVEGRTTGRLGPFRYSEGRTATVLAHHMKSLEVDCDISDTIRDRAYIAPTGTIYVSEDVVKGVLPQVLDEMLTTRAMLKRAAKEYKKKVPNLSPAILRQLEARQLALKYVANVTYGYTSATFSGRCAMPLLADTIVACGRNTLRKTIDLVNKWGKGEHPKWLGCQVIYGDTDSVFVRLPGRSYKEAFDFGEELCRVVTADNPPPVQLKLEKVYLGSIMQTMKRYCGMKFESKDQRKPVFEAKGLETIRKDQCALTQKILRNALITLFRSGPEEVKAYLFRQWSLIFSGNLPIQDFILTGGVRSKYRGGKEGPVQATLARRLAEADPGRVVRHKERLPYVIVATPGMNFRLKDCVLTPLELLERWDAYTIHSSYYIEKHVNASLQRCLGLPPHNINVKAWYQSCPKPRRRIHFWPVYSKSRAMITSYFGSDICSLCQKKCKAQGRNLAVVCGDCQNDRARATQTATLQLNRVQRASHAVSKECSRCNLCMEDAATFAAVNYNNSGSGSKGRAKSGGGSLLFGNAAAATAATSLITPIANCVCIDCPVTFERHRLREREIESLAICKALDLSGDGPSQQSPVVIEEIPAGAISIMMILKMFRETRSTGSRIANMDLSTFVV